MESCIRISLSEYIDPDQSQRFDHSGRNEVWREPFPPARTCDTCRVRAPPRRVKESQGCASAFRVRLRLTFSFPPRFDSKLELELAFPSCRSSLPLQCPAHESLFESSQSLLVTASQYRDSELRPGPQTAPCVTGSGRWKWLPPNLVTPRVVKSLRLVGVYIFGE